MKKQKKMIQKVTVIATIICASVSSVVFADDIQENFLKDMADGLNARWEYNTDENTLSSSEIIEYRNTLVNEEYSRIEKYIDEDFESEKFGMMAKAYIEALEMQMNATKYYSELPEIYEAEWGAGYNVRAFLIPRFVDDFGLSVEESNVAEFRNMGAVSAEVIPEPSDEETTEKTAETKNEEIEVFNDEGIKVIITGMEEPNLTSTRINVRVENLNHHDILVGTSDFNMVVNGNMIYSTLYADVKSGKTANTTLEFYQTELEKAGIDEIKELAFTITITDAETFMPIYEGDEKFLIIDENYRISEKVVYTDAESIQRVQELLNQAGYDCGSADGVPGKKTNNALLQFERDNGLPETTDITPELIETLESIIN